MTAVMTERQYMEDQNKIWHRMQEIITTSEAEDRDLSAAEQENWDAADADLNSLEARYERSKKIASFDEVDRRQIVTVTGEVVDTDEQREKVYNSAFSAYMRGGMRSLSSEQRGAMLEKRVSPQGTGTPADGGFLVAPGYRATMTETMKAYGGMLNYANVINTSDGSPLQWPTNDDTGNVGAILNENTPITELGMTIGTRAIGAFTYTSKLVRVSLQLLQDSVFDLDTWLPRKLGERIGRAVAQDLINGTGTGQPSGILPNAISGATVTNAAFLANTSGAGFDAMISLEHAVDPAYRQMGNCRFMFNDTSLSTIRKFKDTQNRPLWVPVPVPGAPATINGQPYAIDQAMPNLAAGAKAILFGDYRAGFLVRQALDVRAVRLSERYAEILQVGFFGFIRLDATPDDSSAVRYLTTT